MNMHNKKHYYLDLFGLFSIGIVSLGYVTLGRPFAEIHIQLPFLDFPIFIGEMLVLLCLCIFLLKGERRYGKKYLWIIVYFVFVIIKAFYGYSKFGPLAFRNAALFYYPVFIIFAASFYRKDFFKRSPDIILSVIILFLLSRPGFREYWLLTCFSLVFILSYTYPIRPLKYVLLAALFLVTPYRLFFATSRTMMIANFAAGIYLAIGIYSILRIKKTIKVAAVVLGMVLIIGMSVWSSDRNALMTLVRGGETIEIFRARDRDFRAILRGEMESPVSKENPGAQMTRQVRVYNPEPGLSFNFQQPDLSQELSRRLNNDKLVTAENNLLNKSSEDPAMGVLVFEKGNVQTGRPDSLLLKHDPISEVELESGEENSQSEESVFKRDLPEGVGSKNRNIAVAYGNAVFRLFIWRDMLVEMARQKPILGFDFGKPLRSITLETLAWGTGDWGRDGWIAAHNSYLHMFYRAGIIGLLTIAAIFIVLFKMVKRSIENKSLVGIILCGIIINWFIASNFLVILELPYTAIPIWTLFGLTYAYVRQLKPTAI